MKSSPRPTINATADVRVWNEDIALQRLGGDRQMLADLIGFFSEDAPMLRTAMDTAIESNNFAELQRAAHSLKGLLANFEATAAITVAQPIEHAAAKEDLSDVDLPKLDECVEALCSEFATWQV